MFPAKHSAQQLISQKMLASPGDKLGSANDFIHGDGTYLNDDGLIYSSLLGSVVIEDIQIDGKLQSKINVISPYILARQRVIIVGDIVICRVIKCNNNQAFVEIFRVGDIDLDTSAKAVIHKEDVRLKEIDKVNVSEFFNPGDMVRAAVISLGDNKHYFLSTAADGLGTLGK